jgi:hypothetical protein
MAHHCHQALPVDSVHDLANLQPQALPPLTEDVITAWHLDRVADVKGHRAESETARAASHGVSERPLRDAECRVRWGLSRTTIVRLASGSPGYRLVFPPIRLGLGRPGAPVTGIAAA